MKKATLIILSVFVLVSCKNNSDENKTEPIPEADSPEKTDKQNDGLTLLRGDFVFYQDAAVLQTHAEFYGVYITDKMLELNELVQKYKSADTDMVPVEIRGKISNEKHDKILWPNKVEILEILNVFEPKPGANETINLGTE